LVELVPEVGITIGPGDPSYSATLTDASGRYLVCTAPRGSGTDQPFTLTVTKSGYAAVSREVFLYFNPSVDIGLVRQ
jgi:hypothetical protein